MLYTIASHVSYQTKNNDRKENYGPPHHIYDFLISNNKKVKFIKYDLYSKNSSILKQVRNNILKVKKDSNNKKVFYIGINPINGFSGVILKATGRVSKFIYLTPDYADKRFNNLFKNFIYHFLDRISLLLCDENWVVSSRIVKKRCNQALSKDKIKLLPNSPKIKNAKPNKYNGNQNLLIISHLTKSIDFLPIIKSLKILRERNKKLKLIIVGNGPEKDNLKKKVHYYKLGKYVKFLGQKSHEEVFGLMNNAFIGFAIYTQENSWNYYGDSMKAREYAACCLPIIINTIPSTADDVRFYKAGLVLEKIDTNKIVNFINECIDNNKFYLKLRKNSFKMAQDFDKDIILKRLFKLE